MDLATVAVPQSVRGISRKNGQEHTTENFVANGQTLFEQLIGPVKSQMMRAIWRVTRHPELAEDTYQDALTIIWKKKERISRHPNPQALILRICLNAACDTLRKQNRRRTKEISPWVSHQQERASVTSSIPPALEHKEIEEEVLKAIGRLPKKQAAAVLMRTLQDQPYNLIAQALNCSETTARIHVFRGRSRLSRWLSHLRPYSSMEVSE